MKITLLTPNLNNGSSLDRCVRSVITQSFTDLEEIVIDGGSSDISPWMTETIAKDSRIRMVNLPATGVYEALNAGLSMATGNIIGTIHGNDFLTSGESLRIVAETFATHPETDIVFGDTRFIDPSSGRTVREYRSDKFSRNSLLYGFAPSHTAFFARRELFGKFGNYNTSLRNAADFDLIARFILNDAAWIYVPETLSTMTTGGASTKFLNRIFRNPSEKLKAIRMNSCKPDYIRFFSFIFQKFISNVIK